MLKISILGNSVSVVITMFVFAGTGLSPVSVNASTIDLLILPDIEPPPAVLHANMNMFPAIGNLGDGVGRHDKMPPVNPPFDTPAIDNWREHGPGNMPASIPFGTLPSPHQAVVPVPAAVWLFGSGLLGLIGIARRKKA